MVDIQIISKKLIGGGGNWRVYEAILENEEDNPVIIKTNEKVSEYKINQNVSNFELIKSLNLSTLQFYQKARSLESSVILAENLNKSKNIIYVSPNSVITDEQKFIENISGLGKNRIVSLTEQKLYSDKTSTINNLGHFIQYMKPILLKVSQNKVLLEYDSYFLGISNTNILDYKIADFDNIFIDCHRLEEDCYKLNLDELKKVLLLFISHFIIKSEQLNFEKIINTNLK